jgi:hypothetical protein
MSAVPLPSLVRIRKDLVGLLDRQESSAVATGGVRVVALREGPMGGLDL